MRYGSRLVEIMEMRNVVNWGRHESLSFENANIKRIAIYIGLEFKNTCCLHLFCRIYLVMYFNDSNSLYLTE